MAILAVLRAFHPPVLPPARGGGIDRQVIRAAQITAIALIHIVRAVALCVVGVAVHIAHRVRAFLPWAEMPAEERIAHIALTAIYAGSIALRMNTVTAPLGIIFSVYCVLGDVLWAFFNIIEQIDRAPPPPLGGGLIPLPFAGGEEPHGIRPEPEGNHAEGAAPRLHRDRQPPPLPEWPTPMPRPPQQRLQVNFRGWDLFEDPILPPNIPFTVEHLQTRDVGIDDSHVPPNIRIGLLSDWVRELNFTSPEVRRATVIEGRRIPREEILRQVNKVVGIVQRRESVFGSPRAGTLELRIFHESLEKLLRILLDDLANRRRENDPDYAAMVARLGAEVAHSASLCAARWYSELHVLAEQIPHAGRAEGATLAQLLSKELSTARLDLFRSLILQGDLTDTHRYPAWLQKVGGVLGLAGSAGVVEEITHIYSYEAGLLVTRFINDGYTPRFMIEHGWALYIRDDRAHGMMDEWLREQAGNWQVDQYEQTLRELEDGCRPLLQANAAVPEFEHNGLFFEILAAAQPNLPEICRRVQEQPAGDEEPVDVWGNFFTELFKLEAVKVLLAAQPPRVAGTPAPFADLAQQMIFRQQLKTSIPGQVFADWIRANAPEAHREALREPLRVAQRLDARVSAVNRVLMGKDIPPLAPEVLTRVFQDPNPEEALRGILIGRVEEVRVRQFLDEECLTTVTRHRPIEEINGVQVGGNEEVRIPKEALMDQMLVALQILKPPYLR